MKKVLRVLLGVVTVLKAIIVFLLIGPSGSIIFLIVSLVLFIWTKYLNTKYNGHEISEEDMAKAKPLIALALLYLATIPILVILKIINLLK